MQEDEKEYLGEHLARVGKLPGAVADADDEEMARCLESIGVILSHSSGETRPSFGDFESYGAVAKWMGMVLLFKKHAPPGGRDRPLAGAYFDEKEAAINGAGRLLETCHRFTS